MDLSNLVKTTEKGKKRIGRGHGSGKGGHTVGRGKFGQKSREKVGLLFEGTKLKKSLLKRLPLLRGKGRFHPGKKPLIVNLKYLSFFKEGEVVGIETLAKNGIIDREEGIKFGVKILGEGEISYPLTVQLPVSNSARKKLEKAGGKVILLGEKVKTESGKIEKVIKTAKPITDKRPKKAKK